MMISHSFLSLDMGLIPQSTKDNVPTFNQGLFSNDNSRMLIDGYNEDGLLVHPRTTIDAWLQWESNPDEVRDRLFNTSIEYTAEEIKKEQKKVNSIWFIQSTGEP